MPRIEWGIVIPTTLMISAFVVGSIWFFALSARSVSSPPDRAQKAKRQLAILEIAVLGCLLATLFASR